MALKANSEFSLYPYVEHGLPGRDDGLAGNSIGSRT